MDVIDYRIWEEFPHHRIGDDGSVWSRRNRHGSKSAPWTLLKGTAVRGGYLQYCILDKADMRRTIKGHQLVLNAFCGRAPDGCIGCHKNGRPADNRKNNLYWGTPQTNQDDRIAHGNSCRGHLNSNARFTPSQVAAFKEAHQNGESYRSIARRLVVDKSTISRICRGITWKPQINAVL